MLQTISRLAENKPGALLRVAGKKHSAVSGQLSAPQVLAES
jgi:hypothetical protein